MSAPGWRLEALTGIRGIAAWYVVFYHIRLSLVALLPAPAIAVLAKGYLAVDLFFMLSGFVLWLNYAPRLASAEPGQIAGFWWRRVARIWPLHAVVLAGFVVLAAFFALTGRHPDGFPWRELPLQVLLVQNWGFTAQLAWNHPAWSISTEMAAYLLFPLIALSARHTWSTAWLVLAAVALLAGLHAIFAAGGHRLLGDAITSLGLVRCLLEFALGTLAARLWLTWREASRRPLLVVLLTFAALLAIGAGLSAGLPETAFVPLALFCGLLALAFDRGWVARWLGRGPIHWLGEVSYSTYLAHYGLFMVFKLVCVDSSLQLDLPRLAAFLALLLAASAGLYHAVELPAQRWLTHRQPAIRRWRTA